MNAFVFCRARIRAELIEGAIGLIFVKVRQIEHDALKPRVQCQGVIGIAESVRAEPLEFLPDVAIMLGVWLERDA